MVEEQAQNYVYNKSKRGQEFSQIKMFNLTYKDKILLISNI